MAEQSGFFPDVSGDRQYTADFLAQWIASIISNGVYDGDLAITAGSNMQIKVPSGKAWINGYYYRNDGDMALAIANADGVLNRKDTVVLRWDINARSITAQILQGTPASNPAAPDISRTAEQYDLKLAEISIPAGTTAVTQALITDTRLDKAVCGIVTGVVQQVDTTTFYNQIVSDLAKYKNNNEAGFTSWFAGIKNILDSNAAGNLLNLVNNHKMDETVHVTQLTCTKSGTVYVLIGTLPTAGAVQCTFSANAAYVTGDTFTVNGIPYTAMMPSGASLSSGDFIEGPGIAVIIVPESKYIIFPNLAHTAAEVGAVNKSGDTLTGQLSIKDAVTVYMGTAGATNDGAFLLRNASGTFLMLQRKSDGATAGIQIGADGGIAVHPLGNGSNGTVLMDASGHKYADYASGSIALTVPGVRNQITHTASPSGGYEGDSWDVVGT